MITNFRVKNVCVKKFLRFQHYEFIFYFLDAYARSIDQLLYKYIRDGSRDRTRTHHVYREIYGKQLLVKYSRYADPMERTVISLSPLESFRENGRDAAATPWFDNYRTCRFQHEDQRCISYTVHASFRCW